MVGVPRFDRWLFGAVFADGLSLALFDPQQIDDRRSEQENEQQRRHDRAAGAERNIAENIQRADIVAELDEFVEHSSPLAAGPRGDPRPDSNCRSKRNLGFRQSAS